MTQPKLRKKTFGLFLVLMCVCTSGLATDDLPVVEEHFSFKGSSTDLTRLITIIFNTLKSSKLLASNYPSYARTVIEGKYDQPHTIKAIPVSLAASADSILVNNEKFITFKVWGLNARAVFFTDFVYLMKEKDEEAIRNGMDGVRQYRYIEVSYENILPVTEAGRFGGDFSEANKIIGCVRHGLQIAGCTKIKK